MLVLLPPSEGKTPPAAATAPVDLDSLTAAAELGARRKLVLAALAEASARPDATALLGVGESLADQVRRNRDLLAAPAAPASTLYTGVLYAAAGLHRLDAAAAGRAEASVRIFSGLWGVLAPSDRIPAYRLAMATDLPGVGRLAPGWRGPLGAALDVRARREVVVDARSAPYAAAWKPPRGSEWVTVRVVREVAGVRTVVSHNAKHTRGILVGHLLRRQGEPPSDAAAVLAAARELTGAVIGTEIGSGRDYRLLEATVATTAGRRTLELVVG
ncbi:MAG: peroxide stress protein YaaA [Propionicimonas sp.]|nr:peroxide stress protein YaaA [Propionicimonas sp.]